MILVIDKSEKNASVISDIFYYMGILSLSVVPEKIFNNISNRYNAIIISEPEKISSIEEVISYVKEYSFGAPIFALSSNPLMKSKNEFFDYTLFDKVFPYDIYSSEAVKDILTYQNENGKNLIGDYKLAGIDASIFSNEITYFGTPLKFTKTETMIVRYLISAYPTYSTAKDILKFAFKMNKKPEISNIRTHISIINKKFREITGRNLIFSEQKMGYSILTPVRERELATSAK